MNKFSIEDIDTLSRAFFAGQANPAWHPFAKASLTLPSWFDESLDPASEDYAVQQLKLWNVISGVERDYDPHMDETTFDRCSDVVRSAGYYGWAHSPGGVVSAGKHIQATGALMANSNLKPGQRALEYGSGYGLLALNLARLGVKVDTVDISDEFCGYVRELSEFYRVELTPFKEEFGFTPREEKYDLIYFYESIHHCKNILQLLPKLKEALAPTGRIIVLGEPIHEVKSHYIPYPWGIRLDSETVAVIRARGWFELGFLEDYFVNAFIAAGFRATKIVGTSNFDRGYIFTHRGDTINVGTAWMPIDQAKGWYGEGTAGRWSKDRSVVSLDAASSFVSLKVDLANHLAIARTVKITYGDVEEFVAFAPGERKQIILSATRKCPRIVFECDPVSPSSIFLADQTAPRSADQRPLGICVTSITYI